MPHEDVRDIFQRYPGPDPLVLHLRQRGGEKRHRGLIRRRDVLLARENRKGKEFHGGLRLKAGAVGE